MTFDPYFIAVALIMGALGISSTLFYVILKLPKNNRYRKIRFNMISIYLMFMVFSGFTLAFTYIPKHWFMLGASVSLITICYSIYYVFSIRSFEPTPLHKNKVFYYNTLALGALVFVLNLIDSSNYLLSSMILNLNCALVLAFACRQLLIRTNNPTWGEKVLAVLFLVISLTVILSPVVMYFLPSDLWKQCFMLLLAASMLHISHSAICSLILSDNIQLHFENSITDSLTRTYNRRYFMKRAKRVLAESGELPCSVIFCDIDWFKSINDTFGHDCGDRAIFQFAQFLQSSVHADDLVGRLGGEEFAVFLPKTTKEQAFHVAERLRLGVKKLEFASNQHSHRLSASFGVAAATNQPLELLIKRADHALYEAKRSGRDKTVCSESLSVTMSGAHHTQLKSKEKSKTALNSL